MVSTSLLWETGEMICATASLEYPGGAPCRAAHAMLG